MISKFLSPKIKGFTSNYIGEMAYFSMVFVGAILNYAIYPLSNRLLAQDEFNIVVIVLSLALQATSLLAALNIIAFRYSLSKSSKEMIASVQRFFLWACLVFSIIFIALFPVISIVLHINSFMYFMFISLFVLLSVPQYVLTGVLQANHKLGKLGVAVVVTSATQLLLTIILGRYLGAHGVVAANVAGLGIGLSVYFLFGRKLIEQSNRRLYRVPNVADLRLISKEKSFILSVVFATIVLGFLPVVDLFFIQAKMAVQSPQYATPYLIGKLIYFAGAILMWTIIPRLFKQSAPVRNKLVLQLSLALIPLSIVGIIAIYLLRDPLITLFGTSYTNQLGEWAVLGVVHKLACIMFLFLATVALCNGEGKRVAIISLVLSIFYGLIFFIPLGNVTNLLLVLTSTTCFASLLSYTSRRRLP